MSCPTPFKKRYPNMREACEAMIRQNKLKISDKPIVRWYECRCGGFHLTSQPAKTNDQNHRIGG